MLSDWTQSGRESKDPRLLLLSLPSRREIGAENYRITDRLRQIC